MSYNTQNTNIFSDTSWSVSVISITTLPTSLSKKDTQHQSVICRLLYLYQCRTHMLQQHMTVKISLLWQTMETKAYHINEIITQGFSSQFIIWKMGVILQRLNMVCEQGEIWCICLRYTYEENYIATKTIIHTIYLLLLTLTAHFKPDH
jgi:hypothetical protein